MKNFISVDELKSILNDDDLLILDCRSDLKDPTYGLTQYNKAHITNSIFVDISQVLSGEKTTPGGRNPLADVDTFKEYIESLGIDNETKVVAYDDYKITGAARFIWMLRYIGHTNNSILDGGFEHWLSSEGDVSSNGGMVNRDKSSMKINLNSIYMDREELRSKIDDDIYIIDSRASERYLGITEPIDKRKGCIKNANNHYWRNLLNENKTINMNKIRNEYKNIDSKDEVVVYCGSGIDACFNFLLLDELNIRSKVYIGSWSDWISYDDIEELIEVKSK